MTVVAVNIVGDQVAGGLGRAHTMAVAHVDDGTITEWEEYEVAWDESHTQMDLGQTNHGAHHARIVTFMRDNAVEVVVCGHMGPPMAHTLGKMGIHVFVDASGPARECALQAVALLDAAPTPDLP